MSQSRGKSRQAPQPHPLQQPKPLPAGHKFKTLREFYPYYLGEHRNPLCRLFHFIGTGLALGLVIGAVAIGNAWLLLDAAVAGYAFAWVGHFFYERNRPATFTYPVKSLLCDFRLFFELLTRQRPFREPA